MTEDAVKDVVFSILDAVMYLDRCDVDIGCMSDGDVVFDGDVLWFCWF